MVLAVCRRVLRNHHDSEDAFQATFLVLARKAASIASREAIGSWLYGVAYRTALKARATTARRRERQVREMPEPEAAQEDGGSELQPLLDKELNRLPDMYRAPLVLCGLEGRTEKEAAGQLALAQGTLSSRLSGARAMLAKRLARRGVELSLPAASAHVPTALLDSTIKAASLGRATAVSAQVAALTQGVLTAMFLSKLKVTALALVLAVGTVLGTGSLVSSVSGAKEKDGQANQTPAPPKEKQVTTLTEISAAYGYNDAQGDAKFAGKQLRVTAKVMSIRRVHGSYLLATYSTQNSRGGLFQFFPASQKQLVELKPNQEVTIEGECQGRVAREDLPDEFRMHAPLISFHGCKIVVENE